MADILIVYASDEGQTAKIAQGLEARLERDGHRATVQPVEVDPSPEDYDAIVVGAPIHVGRFPKAMLDYVRRNLHALRTRPNAFLAVCLAAVGDDEKSRTTVDGYLTSFRAETGWNPDQSEAFAGALRYRRYGPLKRMLMRRIARNGGLDEDASRDHEYTDWDAVDRFAGRLAGRLGQPSPWAHRKATDGIDSDEELARAR